MSAATAARSILNGFPILVPDGVFEPSSPNTPRSLLPIQDHQKLLLPNAVFHSAPVSAPSALLVSFVPPAVDIQALVQAAAPTLDSSATSTRPRPARARRS